MALVLNLVDLNQDSQISNLQTNKVDLTTFNAAVNDINSKIQTLQTDLENGIADAKSYADSLVQALKDNEIKELQDAVALLNADASTEGSVDYKISQAIANLVDGAPETLDTLKEIVDFIKNAEVDVEGLIDAVNQRVDNLIDGASEDYNTLAKIEARIKEVVAAHAADVENINGQINNVKLSIPVYKVDFDLTLNEGNKITLTKVPFGDIMGRVATLYTTDAAGNIVKVGDFTVTKDTDDTTGKVYIVEIPTELPVYMADAISNGVKAEVQYFYREIDNQ